MQARVLVCLGVRGRISQAPCSHTAVADPGRPFAWRLDLSSLREGAPLRRVDPYQVLSSQALHMLHYVLVEVGSTNLCVLCSMFHFEPFCLLKLMGYYFSQAALGMF